MNWSIWAVLALSMVVCLPAYQAAIVGRAYSIYDGDTFKVNETATGMVYRIRMHGIDAPELSQTCTGADGAEYPCGKVTQQALVNIIGSAPVKCEVQTTDKYNRSVARCWGNEGAVDLGEHLVSNGLAFAYRQYSDLYVPSEESAKAAKLGMWAGSFMFPWDWRRQQSSNDTNASIPPDPDCAIKGNIGSDKQKIYHVPGSRFYNSTAIDESAGERWFCSAYEAEAAGWRPSGCSVKGDIASNGDKVYFTTSSPDYSSVVINVTAGERWFCSSTDAEVAGWRPAGCPIKGDIALTGERIYYAPTSTGYSTVSVNVTAGERWLCTAWDAEVAGWRPAGCPIKGNINSAKEKIYHVPGGRSYNSTVIDVTKGEKWFCTETQAVAAGWRKSTARRHRKLME